MCNDYIVKDGAFAMLTTSSGPDIAPYLDRQIVLLPADAGVHWVKLSAADELILQPRPAGALAVRRVWPQ